MKRLFVLVLVAGGLACSRADEAASFAPESLLEREAIKQDAVGGFGGAAPASPARSAPKGARRVRAKKEASANGWAEDAPMELDAAPVMDEEERSEGKSADEPAPATRAWFPETFLFEPLVETNGEGRATVEVTIPDRLTTWRVLALAHSKAGAQAGTVTTMLGTLPVYVDPNVPKRLLVGDEISLPIQIVNTTKTAVTGRVDVQVEGAALLAAAGTLTVPAGGALVRYTKVRANEPGMAKVSAQFGRYDRVERVFEVRPRGRPVQVEKGGTLAAPRTFELEVPAGADPRTTEVRLVVFPGALSVLRAELASAASRGSVYDDAYALLLAGRAPKLLEALGGKVDADALRKMRIVATQRALAHARAPGPEVASLLTEAALVHGDEPVLKRLGERLASQLASQQRPDGTFSGGNGWTLQRLLVTTADGVRAVRAATDDPAAARRAKGVSIRASGAFERHTRRVDDAYTAAAILASGAVDGSIAQTLRARVKSGIEERGDGARVLKVAKGVVRPDGRRPSEIEATALAVLALAGDESAAGLLPDLGAAILAGYRTGRGFGDGYTNLAALRAVLLVFEKPVPDDVKITLTRGDRTILGGALDPKRKDRSTAFTARLPLGADEKSWTLVATPPVAGLGYNLVVESYVPWPEPRADDVRLLIDVQKDARVGRAVSVELRVGAPPGTQVEVTHGLPVGVRPIAEELARAVQAGQIERYVFDEGALTLMFRVPEGDTPIRYRVIPSFAGKLYAGPSTVRIVGRGTEVHQPPSRWAIR